MILMTLKIALRALARNKVRSALTMLGVIIGVAAVIAMVAVGQGATDSVQKSIASMGQNLLMVFPGASSSGAISFGVGSQQTLTPHDAQMIMKECPSALANAVIVRAKAQVVYENQNWAPQTLQGCDTGFFVVRQWDTDKGDLFTDSDVRSSAQVCVLGVSVSDKLFLNGEDPLGKRVRVNGLPFKVVGILDKKGANAWGQDQDDALFLPYTTCKKKLQGRAFDTVDQILVTAVSAGAMDDLETEMNDCLRAAHHIQRDTKGQWEDDFTVRNMTELMNTMAQVTKLMTLLLAAIASISLMVGGIGIMNIMLVSVTERTREIGLRMAVGARGRDILAQFLVEAMSLSALGGTIGIALGWIFAYIVSRLLHWPTFVNAPVVIIAFVFSAAVGAFFGLYPAWRASQLDPIEALRFE